ncbi:phosphatidylinositol 4-phosphate 5-kinase-like protein 1 [Conger conger]|uniref:phosphatidylinositol 4-phosphate 5-kinase-like protein 1 n=1 Tax=Conger conger TaxID=82655 RepID=UPI002A5AAC77|nr:phosphatidylinositol 4-phosphate 5-kinase-like protein 1 [Conger conger]
MTQNEMEMQQPAPRSRGLKLWSGLRQQWRLLGLFEIDQQHPFHSLTCMMKEGLSAAVQNSIDNPPLNELSEEDFKQEVTQIHKGFRMQSFAGPVFASLRRSLGLTEKEYQSSLSCTGCYLQFISNSKSKADFFLTNDKRFFLKTQSEREIKFLLSHLKVYMEHLERYPHSLLVKFLGVHRIKVPRRRQKYFIIMQSVFYPDKRIVDRYDIKGCEVNRWTDPAPEGSQVIMVLKDMNFEGQFITLGQQGSWLLRQVEVDTAFLQELNVLDYSLLLAHQPLHQDERSQSLSFATLIMRTTKSWSLSNTRRSTGRLASTGSSPTLTGAEEDSALLVSGASPGYGTAPGSPEARPDSPDSPGPLDFRAQNRRLLGSFRNPLHVIDGPEERYFLGIVDVFTVYGLRKRLERLWKRLRHPRRSVSTVSPPAYARRLGQWVRCHVR